MRRTKAKRKLIPLELLLELKQQKELEVPIAVIRRKYNLNISQVALKKLLDAPFDKSPEIHNSYFPAWLTKEAKVQSNPDDWYYEGVFPFGRWRQE